MKSFILLIVRKVFRWWVAAAILIFAVLFGLFRYEVKTSAFQSRFLTDFAEKLSYSIEPGASDSIVFPKAGPFNRRRGYSQIPEFQHNLEIRGYEVTEQARFSPHLSLRPG